MQPSCGIILIFLLVTNPSAVSHGAPATANANGNVTERREMSSQRASTPLRSTVGTTFLPTFTAVSKDGISSSAMNLTSLVTFTTPSNFSTLTKSSAAVSAGVPSTATPSNSAVTRSTHSAAALPPDTPSTGPTTFPTGTALTSPMVTQHGPTSSFNTTWQTTELTRNFIHSSTASSDAEETNKEKTTKEGVIVGIIVAVILGSILIGLIGYFICGKKRPESFSHRRFYDGTRNNPDNSFGPYSTCFGTGAAEQDNAGCPHDGIPMADVTSCGPEL
ncbi:MUC15 protein, partial [Alectura lathami]|nr:MUC15 protein [Alectura lathami]